MHASTADSWSHWLPDSTGWATWVAGVGAGLTFVFSLTALLATATRRGLGDRPPNTGVDRRTRWAVALHVLALTAAVPSVVLLLVMTAMRVTLHVFELREGAPLVLTERLGMPFYGWLAVLVLGVACGLVLATTRSLRLVTPLMWLAILAVVWSALLVPTYVAPERGAGFVRGAASLILAIGVCIVLCVFVIVQGAVRRRARTKILQTDPDHVLVEPATWPGFRISAGAAGLLLVFLACYHLAAPVEMAPGGYRLAAAVMTIVSAAGGAALFALVHRRWNADLADAAMGLVSLAACSAAMLTLPATPALLARRYPLVFNAAVVALAVMTGLWIWLSRVWEQQLDEGRAWTTTGYLVRRSAKFAFFTGSIGLLLATLMAFWPMVKTVPTADDSRGRLAAGIAGFVLLTVSLLAGGRRTRRKVYRLLTVLTVFAMIAFVVIRVTP